MRAIGYQQPGEVSRAVSVNPVDTKVRKGNTPAPSTGLAPTAITTWLTSASPARSRAAWTGHRPPPCRSRPSPHGRPCSTGEHGIEVAVAVTDAGGHLTAFERTDGVPFLAGEVAINKAWTAASYGVATHVWNGYIADPKAVPLANVPRLMPVGGGNPVRDGGKLVGGIGVCGGSCQQDQDIAEAALKAGGFDSPG